MPLIEKKFDQNKVDSIKRMLQREKERGRAKHFEIIVDDFQVVPRTDNVDEFEDYESAIDNDSQNVSILIYDGPLTNRNKRYSFFLQGEPPIHDTRPVNGLGAIEEVIALKLDEKEREYEVTRLREQLNAVKGQLSESEEYAESLEKRIKEMEDKRYTQAVSLGEVASVVLKTLVKQHASRIPGGQALAGLLGADVEEIPVSLPVATEATASFEKQPDSQPLNEQTRNRLSLIEQMQERFTEQQMVAVFSIIDSFTAAPEKIPEVLALLGLNAAPATHP